MSDLLIFLALLPALFLVLGGSKKITQVVLWLPALVALASVGNSLMLHIEDPKRWIPLASFFAVAISELIEKKKISSLSVLCLLFIGQALLSENIGNIIICLALADIILNIETFTSIELEKKNSAIHNIYKSLFSFFPVILGELLRLQGDLLTLMVLITITVRLFSWPVTQWHSSGGRFSGLLISAGSTFALWHVLDFSLQPEWALVWLCIAAFFSLGGSYIEMYLALSLGVFCISPIYGVLATALWPLLLHQGKINFLLIIFTGVLGLLISDFSKQVLLENVLYGLACISAIMIVRPFVAIQIKNRVWFKEIADGLLSLGLLGLYVYIIPLSQPEAGPVGITFGTLFLVTFVIGFFLRKGRPKIFKPLGPIKTQLLPDRKEPLSGLEETPGVTILFQERPFLMKFYSMLESESHFALILGALGLALIWGRK